MANPFAVCQEPTFQFRNHQTEEHSRRRFGKATTTNGGRTFVSWNVHEIQQHQNWIPKSGFLLEPGKIRQDVPRSAFPESDPKVMAGFQDQRA
ncbi:MAG: hypothetical protein ACOC98_15635, partial [Thermodesulfobacteriota bacterium]